MSFRVKFQKIFIFFPVSVKRHARSRQYICNLFLQIINSFFGVFYDYKQLDGIPSKEYNMSVWEVEYTDEFNDWWETLSKAEQDAVGYSVTLLVGKGPFLKFPYSSDVKQSKHGTMRELRSQCGRNPLRTFYAFDPRRTAILLIGGIKTKSDRFYDVMVPKADRIYDEYLKEIQEENND
jgi:hypothetical protein